MGKKKNKKTAVAWSINKKDNNKDTNKKATETKTSVATTNNNTKTTANTFGTCSGYYSKSKNYNLKGRKNETEYPKFIDLCKHTQNELKIILGTELLEAGYNEVVTGDGYVYAKGTVPVLLTAHMDTVHRELIKDFYEYFDEEKKQHIISSPQGIGGDDRCGIYMILELIKTHKCSVLFCEDEESGGQGSSKFCKTELIEELSGLNYLIELDRKGDNDAVFYDCDNADFTKFIEDNTGYKENYGSFSDISTLSPACKVASVNLSCGYYNAHTTSEYVIMEEMFNTIEVVKKLLDVECEQFEYIENKYYGGYYSNYYGNYYGNNKGSESKISSKYGYNDYYDEYWNGYQDGYCIP